MKIMIQFPTRNRPDRFFTYLGKYISMAKTNPMIHVSMDVDDDSMNNPVVKEKLVELGCQWTFSENKTKHEAVNKGIANHSFDILLLASDDMLPIVDGYDEIIINDMKKYFPDTDGALFYPDGNRRDLNTLQIMGRKYFDRFGYVYRQEYLSFYGDTEFQAVAEILGKLQFVDNCIIKHEHHSVTGEAMDECYKRNWENAYHDDVAFEKRKTLGFPIERDW
jgi:hypothetical protein